MHFRASSSMICQLFAKQSGPVGDSKIVSGVLRTNMTHISRKVRFGIWKLVRTFDDLGTGVLMVGFLVLKEVGDLGGVMDGWMGSCLTDVPNQKH